MKICGCPESHMLRWLSQFAQNLLSQFFSLGWQSCTSLPDAVLSRPCFFSKTAQPNFLLSQQ
jgi:hypothetical protein